jgi:hypothetical protein
MLSRRWFTRQASLEWTGGTKYKPMASNTNTASPSRIFNERGILFNIGRIILLSGIACNQDLALWESPE